MKKANTAAKDNKQPSGDLQKLGARIKHLRLKHGHTNREIFAYQSDIDRVQLGRYENGLADMQYSSLLKIVRAFGMTLSEFFAEGFDKK